MSWRLFNSTVSHDLRNPLMVIQAFAERIMKNYEAALDEKFLHQMGIIQMSAKKMEQLIDDLFGILKTWQNKHYSIRQYS